MSAPVPPFLLLASPRTVHPPTQHPPARTLTRHTLAGTSDEHLSLIEHMAPVHARLSAVLVTTPQAVALLDALKCLSFARATGLPVLGLVENMSGYVCPCCGELANVFSTGGGAAMAAREGLAFLGALPVDTALVELLDAAPPAGGESEDEGVGAGVDEHAEERFELLARYERTATAPLFKQIVDKVLGRLSEVASGGGPTPAPAGAAAAQASTST